MYLFFNYRDTDSDYGSHIAAAIEEIEDSLYYFSDVISAGIPELGRLISDNLLQIIVFPLLLPSLRNQSAVSNSFLLFSVVGSKINIFIIIEVVNVLEFKSSEM